MADEDLPEGVVTFVFTDIEGSTRLLQDTGEAFVDVLETHRQVLRSAFAEFGGREVNTEGDGCFVAFTSPAAAVLAAVRAQRDFAAHPLLAEHGVNVRIGMHTGEAQRTGHDYVGLAVHHASRVANAGHGGQVLVSEATRVMAGDLDGVEFEDLGEHLLKDLARRARIFQVWADGLERKFPPLRSLNRAEASLPTPRSSFVGREGDLNTLLDDLTEPGLVTLTGPGGTGKTRLAIEAARELRGSLDAVWFVDLQAIAEGAQVITTAAAALDVLDGGQATDNYERLCERVGARPCLIVLDNCEHLVESVGQLAERLLEACPELRLLATSRDLLGLANERARRVAPLDPASASQLFVDRARRVVAGFAPDESEALVIGQICKRLDGIPLAIELAAPRLRHMAPSDLAERLGDVFQLLVGGRTRGLRRHQTLEAVVDWSYNLLSAEEQVVLRRLSALTGSFTMEAANAVTGGDPVVGPVEEMVFRLVDHSLVEHDGGGRYRQLETLRAYGQAKLSASGEAAAVRDRHVAHFLELAEGLVNDQDGRGSLEELERLDLEADNLHAALDWATARGDSNSALRLIAATVAFATFTSREAYVDLAERALTASGEGAQELRASAHVGFAVAATAAGWDRHGGHAATAMELLGPEGADPHPLDPRRAWALASLALIGTRKYPPDVEETRSYADRATALAERCHLPSVEMAAQSAVAWQLMRTGQVREARELLARVLELDGAPRSNLWRAVALFWSGIAAMRDEDWPAAVEHYEAVLPLFRRVSYKLYTQWVLDHLSEAMLNLGDDAAARAYAEEGVNLSIESGLPSGNLAYLYDRLGNLEGLRGDHSQAAVYYEKAADLVSQRRDPHDYAAFRSKVAGALVQCGELDGAREHISVALGLTEGLGPCTLPTGAVTPPPVAPVAQAIARLALASGSALEAAELSGAVQMLHPDAEASPMTRRRLAGFRDEVRAALGDDELFAAALDRGRRVEDPLARASEVFHSLSTPAPPAPAPG